MNVSAPVDPASITLIIAMGVVILIPTVVMVVAIVAGRLRDPHDDPHDDP